MFLRMLVLASALIGLSTGAFAADTSFFGTWKVNEAKSHVTNPQASGSNMLIIAPYGDDGWTHMQLIYNEPPKTDMRSHYSAKFDGKQYPLFGNDPRTMSVTRVDAHTLQAQTFRDGKPGSQATYTVSNDGKTLTVNSSGVSGRGVPFKDSMQVYDRQ